MILSIQQLHPAKDLSPKLLHFYPNDSTTNRNFLNVKCVLDLNNFNQN